MTKNYSFPKNKIKILLLENIHPAALECLREAGYSVTGLSSPLSPEELAEQITDTHVVGICSKTQITAKHIECAKRLMAIGCFTVGSTQIDLDAATSAGVPVFNAAYGNTRSVAELAIGNMIALARNSAASNAKMHSGRWERATAGAHEIRDKTIGVVGYGHVGQQVGILAEALGMQVVFYDVIKCLPLGNSRQVPTLDELLAESDFVSLHLPQQLSGEPLITEATIKKMRRGAYLLNLSNGNLVNERALKSAIESGHLAGAALDVFQQEPESNHANFHSELVGMERVILTPHIGGRTDEARFNMALEVASSFIKYIDAGSTEGAINFPQIDLPTDENSHRILNIHRNVPGVLRDINILVSELGANINGQYLSTYKDVGYLVMDVNRDLSNELKSRISTLGSNIRTRILY